MNRGGVRSANLPLGSEKSWPAYNLFRHKLMPDLFCAVPQDCPVPGFIEGSAWAFAGTLSERTLAPAGLDSETAAAGMRRSGFYLFQTHTTEPGNSSASPGSWSDLQDALSWQMDGAEVRVPEQISR